MANELPTDCVVVRPPIDPDILGICINIEDTLEPRIPNGGLRWGQTLNDRFVTTGSGGIYIPVDTAQPKDTK